MIGYLIIAILLCAVTLFSLFHRHFEPKSSPYIPPVVEVAERARIENRIQETAIDLEGLARRISNAKVLLVGEDHYYVEPPQFFLQLLEVLGNRKLIISLEILGPYQAALDKYMQTGLESDLGKIWSPDDCASLPYQEIVRWAFAHKSRVLHVLAHDESYLRNRFMRFFLTDTRNETMARTVHNIYSDYPESMVVAYGGMAHMLKSGRYLYDLSNRTPLGARLKKYGLSRFEVTTVIVSGGELAPIDTLFKKEEIIPVDQEWNSVLPSLFLGFSTFGIARPQDAFDYFVHLPTLTLKSAPFDGSCKIPPFRFSAPWI